MRRHTDVTRVRLLPRLPACGGNPAGGMRYWARGPCADLGSAGHGSVPIAEQTEVHSSSEFAGSWSPCYLCSTPLVCTSDRRFSNTAERPYWLLLHNQVCHGHKLQIFAFHSFCRLRFVAYKQSVRWMWQRLGSHNRHVLPAYVVGKNSTRIPIRDTHWVSGSRVNVSN